MKTSNIKIGLFGGSFDPIHNGHLQLAKWARIEVSLNRIIFIPAAIPPHKLQLVLTDPKHRYRMVQLAIQGFPDFEISDMEIKRDGVSFTIDTIIAFKKKFHLSKENLFLMIGADSLFDFHNWREPNRILANCQVVVFPRPQVSLDEVAPEIKNQIIIFLSAPVIPISATDIREKVKQGESIVDLVPPLVAQYIYEHHLYR